MQVFGLSRCPALSIAGILLLTTFAPAAGHADVRAVVNSLRDGGCSASNKLPALHIDTRLESAVEQMSRGVNAEDATQALAYPTMQLSTIRLTGYESDEAIRAVLKQKYCSLLMQPEWRDIGSAQYNDTLWIVLAVPHAIPANTQAVAREVLTLVNEARATARRCGQKRYASTTPLRLNSVLNKVAQLHADDMAQHRLMQHAGSDGSTPAQRISRQGYRWKAVGENVAAGAGNAAEVVAGWLDSPGHCANIMNPMFTEMGAAYAVNKRDEYAVYWTQNFATPR
jgi:uncharacterized protein YkwD